MLTTMQRARSLRRSHILPLSLLMTATRFSSLHSLVAHASADNGNNNNINHRTYTSSTSLPTKLPSSLPSSLQASGAIRALVEPGLCQFDTSPKVARLLSRTQVSPTSFLLKFELPDPSQSLQLTTCACILAHTSDADGNSVTRPYTPITTNAQVGSFDLLVKDYSEYGGVMSHYLCHVIQPADANADSGSDSESSSNARNRSRSNSHVGAASGDCVSFTHIDANVKISAADELIPHCQTLVLIAGGTGITPMIQVLHAMLGGNDGPSRIVLLYGSKHSGDILAKNVLDAWAASYSQRLHIVHVLSQEPEHCDSQDSSDGNNIYDKWIGRRGFIDKTLLQEYLPQPPTDDTRILVCGPPPMYESLCGPRTESDKVTGVLAELGYTSKHVYKF